MGEDSPGSAGQKLVLVVDDDPHIRGLLETTIQSEGFRVLTAVNGFDAAKKMAAAVPDLIITDLMMTGQGGYEFLRDLQSSGRGRIPVFVISAITIDPSTVEMIRREANVVEFIAKPIPMAAFRASLHQVFKAPPPGPEGPLRPPVQ